MSKIIPFRRGRDELAFLPAALEIVETPPSPVGRAVAFILAGLFTAALAWSWWGTIDIVASGRLAIDLAASSGASVRVRRIATYTVVGEMGFFRHSARSAPWRRRKAP